MRQILHLHEIRRTISRHLALLFAVLLPLFAHAAGPITYDERVQGDLPTYRNPPSLSAQFILGVGTNTFTGSMATSCCGGDFDTISFAVPASAKLTGVYITYETSPLATGSYLDMTYGMEFSYGTMPYFAYAGTPYAPALVSYPANEGCCYPLAFVQEPLFSSALLLGPGNYTLDFVNVSNPSVGKVFSYTIALVVSDATIPPSFSLSPTTLNFGTVQTNATSTAQTIALTSTGGLLTISSLVMSGTNPGDFLITGNTCTTVLSAGQGCSFGVAFSPIAANARNASLQILSNAPTQTVVLQGVGGPSTSSMKADTKCVKSFLSQVFDNKTICDIIHTLRDRFNVNRDDASNDLLYAWLQNDGNKSAALALIGNETLGKMVQAYLTGDTPWDSKIYRSQVAAIYNGGNTLISLTTKLKIILDILGRENPVVSFIDRVAPIFEIVQVAVDAYINVNSVLQAQNAKFILADYIKNRCGTENRVHCTGNDAVTLTLAQDIVRIDDLPLVQQLLCKAFSSATCNPIPESDIVTYLNSLELSYQAFRLVGYTDDSPLIRQELGKKLVSVIKNPAQ